MQNIRLKKFQIDTVNQLLDATSIGTKKEILLSAPTGAGKTIILLSYIEEFIREQKKTIFVWLTPGAGDLEEQSRNKMKKMLPAYDTQNIQDVLLQGFKDNSVAFINWETITKKGNTALKEAERKNLYERIIEAQNKGYEFIAIIDEAHLNKTVKAESIVNYMNPKYIIRTSATPKRDDEAELIDVNELDVINSGLITRALYINEGVSNENVLSNEHEYLLNLAIEKRKLIKAEYIKNNIQVNPMIIIQVPSKSDALIEQIEKILEAKMYSYDRNNLAIWLSERKENIDNITDNDAQPAILIIKQAVSTGWDCPRAKILVKLRDNMSEDFETQTIGRIRRMPHGHHYENVLLDNCYLYTFDEKYEETIKQELGKNASNVKVVFLKKEHRDFTLKKISIDSDFEGFGDRETFNIIYNYLKNKYNLGSKKIDNQTILESNGYSFSKNIRNSIVQGKFIKLEDIKDGERIKIESKVDTHKNGFQLRNAIDQISSRIGLGYDITRKILERMFETNQGYSKRFLDLKIVDFYAFIINNVTELKHDFTEAVSQAGRQEQIKLENVKEINWQIPEEDYVKYDSKSKDSYIYTKEVYMEYPSSVIKSKSEMMFENYCQKSDNVKWFYKNGESSKTYFSIVYEDAIKRRWHFYPDFIICDKNDKIWIIETKGGENASGESKNIDIKAELKFNALKEYAERYKLHWAFVRDYDKNNELYYNNTKYSEEMTDNSEWIKLDNMF